jgi:cytochrome c oxidase subunit 2
MRFKVIAQPQDEYDAWVREQQAEAAQPTGLAAQGATIVAQTCTACHTVNGLKAANGQPAPASINGPNLTHLMGRSCFAGCVFDVTEENLTKWVDDPPAMKPGSLMPDYNLTPDQIQAVVAYLQTLK